MTQAGQRESADAMEVLDADDVDKLLCESMLSAHYGIDFNDI